MTVDDWIGFLGVALLLIAYFLNLRGWPGGQGRPYATLNVIGSGLACLASYRIGFAPFVLLEGVWMAVSLAALLRGTTPPDDQAATA